MALQPGDIEKALNNYRSTRAMMSPLVDFAINEMLHHIDFEKSNIIEDDDAVAIQFESTKRNLIPVLFIFWLDNNRFSLFMEDKEVIDDYLGDDSEVQKTLRCARTILTHEIFRVRFTRSGKIRKVIYTYSAVKENGAIDKYEDESILAITLPWHRNERSEHLFEPWILK